jgi:hypothetical protein
MAFPYHLTDSGIECGKQRRPTVALESRFASLPAPGTSEKRVVSGPAPEPAPSHLHQERVPSLAVPGISRNIPHLVHERRVGGGRECRDTVRFQAQRSGDCGLNLRVRNAAWDSQFWFNPQTVQPLRQKPRASLTHGLLCIAASR